MPYPIRNLILLFAIYILPLANAAGQVAQEQQGDVQLLGKAIGGMFFGYFAMKISNRNKVADDGSPHGTSKILIGILILVILIALTHLPG